MVPLLLAPAVAAAPLPFSPEDAEPLPRPSAAQIEKLEPRRHLLPATPRGQIDFTAYTLEWGEVRLGLGGVAIGVLPRTQVGTAPVLDALGAANVSAKVNALRVGPLDVAATGTWLGLSRDGLDARYLGAGGAVSLQVVKPWSVHGSANWLHASVRGTPQLDAFALMLGQYTGNPVDGAAVDAAEDELSFDAHVGALTVKAATDIRINRRDSIVLQGQSLVWRSVDMPAEVEGLVADSAGWLPVTEVSMASVAWQLSGRHVDLRLGAGVSSVPGAWLLNTVDVAYRFGGETRVEERRMRKGWRLNKKAIGRSWRQGTLPDAPDAAEVAAAAAAAVADDEASLTER